VSQMEVVQVSGPLHARQGAQLREEVCTLLRRGERAIVVRLASVSKVDAAGIGELVRAYQMSVGVAAVLRVTEATGRVREVLARVGLLDLLSKPQPAICRDCG
jgi:anti-anti-sigma factor